MINKQNLSTKIT